MNKVECQQGEESFSEFELVEGKWIGAGPDGNNILVSFSSMPSLGKDPGRNSKGCERIAKGKRCGSGLLYSQ